MQLLLPCIQSGKRNAAKVIQKADVYKYTLEEALSLFIDGDYTKETYNSMRTGAKKRNADIYPAYNSTP